MPELSASVPATAASNTNRGCCANGRNQRCTGTGSGIFRPNRLRSMIAITAGNIISSAAQQSRIPPPAINPNSATPTKLVNAAEKNAIDVVTAPVKILGPTERLVSIIEASQPRPSRRIAKYRPI